MAIIHEATLTPTKLELLAQWLPGRAWYPGDSAEGVQRVAACRFDDPAGEVGVQTFVVRAGDGPLVHVPMTYRAQPLADAEHWLIGTAEHSVLGARWVYDAVGDPVYIAALVEAIRTGGHEAEEVFETESGPRRTSPLMAVKGSGSGRAGEPVGTVVRVEDGDPAVVVTDEVRLSIRRVLTQHPADEELSLTGTWTGATKPLILATLS
nr:hypothetical protein [uncultured Actinoplanes sp.]